MIVIFVKGISVVISCVNQVDPTSLKVVKAEGMIDGMGLYLGKITISRTELSLSIMPFFFTSTKSWFMVSTNYTLNALEDLCIDILFYLVTAFRGSVCFVCVCVCVCVCLQSEAQ